MEKFENLIKTYENLIKRYNFIKKYGNVRDFFWRHVVNFDMEYFLLLLIISHRPCTIYHLLLLIALFLYWYREKSTELLDIIRLFVRFVLCYKIFFLNFITQLIEPTEFYYYAFMYQISKSLFNYCFSTGEHTLNNFNYDFSLNELITLNFTVFVAVNRKRFTLVWLYIACAVVHYVIVLASQFYLSHKKGLVIVEKSSGSGDTSHFSLIVPSTGDVRTSQMRYDIIINRSQNIEVRQAGYKERPNGRWWNRYFIPFMNVGIIGNQR